MVSTTGAHAGRGMSLLLLCRVVSISLKVRLRYDRLIVKPHNILTFDIKIVFEWMLNWCKICIKIPKIRKVDIYTR